MPDHHTNMPLLMHLFQRIRIACAIQRPRTRDFTTGSTSCGSQNIVTRFCKAQCGNASAKLSVKPVPKRGFTSCEAFWRATMCTCFCRSRTSCSASRVDSRDAFRWSFQNCISATGAGGFSFRASKHALSGRGARGYFSTTSGNVTDDIIMQYLELHSAK